MSKWIYADHAATTAISPVAYVAMQPWLQEEYGNPSTLYSIAREPRKAIDHSREIIATAIGADPEEIFFTSGGTEANNWAIKGTVFKDIQKNGVITSCIEHHAVLNPCTYLKRLGFSVDYLSVDTEGVVNPLQLKETISDSTSLVSVMYANNEIGSLQPIVELSAIAHDKGCLFHTDAVQAVGHIPINVRKMGIDMLSASAHKFNGPKGVGFLFIRKGVILEPLLHGGAQEKNMRAGTENVAGIVGMAAALNEHINYLEEETAYLNELCSILLGALRETNIDFRMNGAENRIPGSLSLSFRGADGEMLVHRLDLMGTFVSTGSACDSSNTILSHVLQAINLPDEYAYGTIRISLGMDNTKDQMIQIAKQLERIIKV